MLRIGLLGAARIAPAALIYPARQVDGVDVVAVAARDPVRAAQFAARHDIPVVHRTYGDLIADPDIDAVYNPLPNSLHHEWTVRALEADKHVLCEKPIASNTTEAKEMAVASERSGKLLMEAFHYQYHPFADRMRNIIDSGVLGAIRHIQVDFCVVLRRRNDIRLQADLAGGAMMDLGCYAVHLARSLADAEPAVRRATAKTFPPAIDRRMDADLLFPNELTAHICCAFFSRNLFKIQALVHGERGYMRAINPILPHFFNLIILNTDGRRHWERVAGDTTYNCQLRAFAEAIRTGVPPPTDARDAVANMRVIDAVYAAAGLPLRGRELADWNAPT